MDIDRALAGTSAVGSEAQGISVKAFLASLTTAVIIFAAEIALFLVLRGRLVHIYQPRTPSLVPDSDCAFPLPSGLIGWLRPVFRSSRSEFIRRCGLDAYFFLRYLRMLLKIFVPLSCIIVPVLLPLNVVGGEGRTFKEGSPEEHRNITGLDLLSWGNISPEDTHRYWAHLVMALVVIAYTCVVFFDELRHYIRIREEYLPTSRQRLCSPATTVLMLGISESQMSTESLKSLFSGFPGGVRDVWLNRNFDMLSRKIKARDTLAAKLELAETKLIIKCEKVYCRQGKAAKADKNTWESLTTIDRGVDPRSFVCSNGGSPSCSTQGPARAQPMDGSLYHATAAMARACGSEKGAKRSYIKPQVERRGSPGPGSPVRPTVKGPTTGGSTDPPLAAESCPSTQINQQKDGQRDLSHVSRLSNRRFASLAHWPLWKEYIEMRDRPTMRLSSGTRWMSWIPFVGEKVDTIIYCRKELARLNREIEIDKLRPDRFPLLNSAFIQFNTEIAAQMACQRAPFSISRMPPHVIQVSLKDVIWDNLSLSWWERWIRTFGVVVLVSGMIIGWAIPVAFCGLFSQLSSLERAFPWLSWVAELPEWFLSAAQGILPALFMAVLMTVLPVILRMLCKFQGHITRTAVELLLQNYYFAFLFMQQFLLIAVSSSFSMIGDNIHRISSWPELLAQGIPASSNYFFSYMILQAMSVSAGSLVQIGSLISVFILSPLLDKTARSRWSRIHSQSEIRWGTFFPVYTTLASIGLIYSVVSPLILIFNVVTFSLFWFAYRYTTLYVSIMRSDSGGLHFPRAINQLFTGLYVMEVSLIGLFFIVRGVEDTVACKGQASCMIVAFLATALYQILLNKAFSPLTHSLALDCGDYHDTTVIEAENASQTELSISNGEIRTYDDDMKATRHSYGLIKKVCQATPSAPYRTSYLAAAESAQVSECSVPGPGFQPTKVSRTEMQGVMSETSPPALYTRRENRPKNHTPDERDNFDELIFQHEAFQSQRPVIWIPRDNTGVSSDEVQRTRRFSNQIPISNANQVLTERIQACFTGPPPGLCPFDLMSLQELVDSDIDAKVHIAPSLASTDVYSS